MSNDNPLKRYGPTSKYVDTGIGGYDEVTMEEVSGGFYINEDDIRKRLDEMLDSATDAGERHSLQRVLKILDAPDW